MVTVKRYFSIMFCAVFLFQTVAIGGTEKSGKSDASIYKNYRLSDLFLTENEIRSLNDDDRTAYMVSIIQLAQILEISQNMHVGLHDRKGVSSVEAEEFEDVAQQIEKIKISLPENVKTISFILFGEKAEAVLGLIAKGARWAWKSKTAIKTFWSGEKAVVPKLTELSWAQKQAVKAAAQKEMNAAGRTAVNAVKRENKKIGIPRQAIDAEIKSIKNSDVLTSMSKKIVEKEAQYAKLSADLAKAKKAAKPNPRTIASLEKRMEAKAAQINKDTAKYTSLGGDRVALTREVVKQNRSRGARAMAALGVGATVYSVYDIGADVANSTGIAESFVDAAEKVKSNRFSKHKAINGQEIVGEEVMDPTKKEEGYGCLYGGYPSKFVNFSGDVKCTNPTEFSVTKSCNKSGKFKCNSYGLTEDGKNLDEELCINKGPLDTLTFRCSVRMAEVHEEYQKQLKEQFTQESDEWMAYQEKVKLVVENMEKSPFMQDSEGRVRTIGSYCQTTNELQKGECEGVMTLLNTLKDTGHFTLAQKRIAAAVQARIDNEAGDNGGYGNTPSFDSELPHQPSDSGAGDTYPSRAPTETSEGVIGGSTK